MGVKSYNLKLGSRHPDTQHLHPNLWCRPPSLSSLRMWAHLPTLRCTLVAERGGL